MALKKTTYVSGSTIITAENLNDIQDTIIALEEKGLTKEEVVDALEYTPAKASDIPTTDISANTAARHSHNNKDVLDNIAEITSVSGGTISGTDSSLATKKALDTMKTQIESDFPTSLKNPKTLTFTGAVSGTYDGSTDLTVNIPSGGSGTGGQGQDGKSVNWRGEYGASTAYSKLDAVSYNGSSYIYSSSISASGKVPGVDNEWDLMAEKGEDGSPGADGKDGKNGTNGTNGADGSPGIVISSTQPTSDTHPVWLDPDGDVSAENPLGLTSATVGQIAKISAVDDNGVPTAWEPVDMPSGGGLQWIEIVDITTEEQTQKLTISVDKDGRPISQYNALWMIFSILFPADASQTSTTGTVWIFSYPKLGDNAYRYIASVPGWKTITRTLTHAWAGLPRLAWSSAMAGQTTFGTVGDPDFLSGLCVYLNSSSDHIPVGTRVRIAVLSKGVAA